MGNLLSGTIKNFVTDQPCNSFIKDFPDNIGKMSLPSIILDGIGLTCSTNKMAVGINLVANVGGAIGLYVLNTNVGLIRSLSNIIPKIFSTDGPTNLTILEYLIANGILFVVDATGRYKSPLSDHLSPLEVIEQCMEHPLECAKDAVRVMANLTPTICRKDQESSGGLCYDKCKAGYTGDTAWCRTSMPTTPGWRNDGLYMYHSFPRTCPATTTDIGVSCQKDSYVRGVGKVPSLCPNGWLNLGLLCQPPNEELMKTKEDPDYVLPMIYEVVDTSNSTVDPSTYSQ